MVGAGGYGALNEDSRDLTHRSFWRQNRRDSFFRECIPQAVGADQNAISWCQPP